MIADHFSHMKNFRLQNVTDFPENMKTEQNFPRKSSLDWLKFLGDNLKMFHVFLPTDLILYSSDLIWESEIAIGFIRSKALYLGILKVNYD